MRTLSRSTLARSTAVLLCLVGATGCGESEPELPVDDGGVDAPLETSTDSDIDSTTETGDDGGTETGDDASPETGDDVGETGEETSGETGDDTSPDGVVTDTAIDTSVTDTGSEVATDAAACTTGTLCADDTPCIGGVCTPCSTDTQCSSIASGRLCYSGKCLVGTCKPAPAANTCSVASGAPNSICCSTATTAGSCFSTSGRTSCCSDANCTTGGLTKCDLPSHTCACPAPTPGTWHVAPTGSDTETIYAGNGSSACPFKTVGKAISKMLSGTPMATTIVLRNGTTGSPAVYGTSCTGGAPCDSATLTIPATWTHDVTFRGAGGRAETVVTLATDQVFSFGTSDVSVENLTIRPTKTGGIGILYDGASSATPGTLRDVVVSGTSATGAGILIRGSTNPVLGGGTPGGGLRVELGTHGILVQGTASPSIVGVAGAATQVLSTLQSCIRLESAAPTTAPRVTIGGATSAVTNLSNCGGVGIDIETTIANTSSIDRVAITRTGLTSGFVGIRLLNNASATLSNVNVNGVGERAIWVRNSASLTTTAAVVVSSNASGVVVNDNATANLQFVTANFSLATGAIPPDGVRCETTGGTANVRLRNVTTLGNAGNGVFINGCSADLGGGGSPSNNAYNRTSQRNGLSGLCFNGSGPGLATPNATWSCNYTGAGCTSTGVSPTVSQPVVFACSAATDLTIALGKTYALSPYTCCN